MRLRMRDIRELVVKALFAEEFQDSGESVNGGPLWQLSYIANDAEMSDRGDDMIALVATITNNERARRLIEGVHENKNELDKIIARYSVDWGLDRLGVVELTVMRMSLFEMLYGEKLAPAIVINEAVDIIKKYGQPEAAAFVNGILGKKAYELAAEERITGGANGADKVLCE